MQGLRRDRVQFSLCQVQSRKFFRGGGVSPRDNCVCRGGGGIFSVILLYEFNEFEFSRGSGPPPPSRPAHDVIYTTINGLQNTILAVLSTEANRSTYRCRKPADLEDGGFPAMNIFIRVLDGRGHCILY